MRHLEGKGASSLNSACVSRSITRNVNTSIKLVYLLTNRNGSVSTYGETTVTTLSTKLLTMLICALFTVLWQIQRIVLHRRKKISSGWMYTCHRRVRSDINMPSGALTSWNCQFSAVILVTLRSYPWVLENITLHHGPSDPIHFYYSHDAFLCWAQGLKQKGLNCSNIIVLWEIVTSSCSAVRL